MTQFARDFDGAAAAAAFAAIVTAAVLLPTLVVTRRRAGASWRTASASALLDMCLLGSVAAICAATLNPISSFRGAIQVVPFSSIIGSIRSPATDEAVRDVLGNVALFAPMGAVLAARRWSLRRCGVTAALLAAAIEVVQALAPLGRIPSVDDVILNVVGALLGGGVVTAGTRRLLRRSAPVTTAKADENDPRLLHFASV